MQSKDPRLSLEDLLAANLPSIPVPDDFLQRIHYRIRTAPTRTPLLPRWALAAAAALALVAVLAGFEIGRSRSAPPDGLPAEQAMLLLNQASHPL